MADTTEKLLGKVHHLIATVLTLGFFGMMALLLRPFTFSPDPLIAQAQATFAAVPVAATFWFACYMFLVVLADQRKQRADRQK